MAKPEPELIELMLRAHAQFVVGVTGDMARFAGLPPQQMREALVGCVDPVLERATAGRELSEDQRAWLRDAVLAEAFGLGPLEGLLREMGVDAIVIRGPREVRVERGGQLEETVVVFADQDHVERTVQRHPAVQACVRREGDSLRIDVGRLKERLAAAAAGVGG